MNNAYFILEHKSILDNNKKIVFFSVERIISEIAEGNCCFICGAKPEEKKFNNEHVIPDWILRKYKLHNRSIVLPNRNPIRYSQYKVPCCVDCNQLLSEKLEKPISKIVSEGFESFQNYLNGDGFKNVFQWLSLIFLKVHLKDKFYHLSVDKRETEYKISELYDWESLHHIHCVARSIYTNCLFNSKIFGSLFLFRVKIDQEMEQFDYSDLFFGKGILIRLGEIGLIAILNDSCGSMNLYQDELKKISGQLSPLQYREILAHLSFINVNLKNRPIFYITIDPQYGLVIKGEVGELVEFEDKKIFNFGDFLYGSCYYILSQTNRIDKDFIIENVKKGKWSFLFDETGNFREIGS